MDIQKWPKIELHVHLDGSLRIETVQELLPQRKDIRAQMIASLDCKDLNAYLTKFDLPGEVMQTKENIKRVSRELAEDLCADGIIYAEIRFAPMKHTKKGLTIKEVLDAVLEGLQEGPIETGVLLSLMRGAHKEDNQRVVELARRYIGKGVVGLDLAGAEAVYRTRDYEDIFTVAAMNHIPFTIHAGEADGPESIWDALSFGASRIGHGIRAIEDPLLIKELTDRNIVLEVCPTSNLQTKAVLSYLDHPLLKLYEKGVHVTINTDNRTVSHVTLTEEYQNIEKIFSFTKQDFIQMNLYAINASFLEKEKKEKLLERYLECSHINVDEMH